ncbi:MAG: LLM class flavin-dependent oxidoreductase [Chloroflexi bacterium]|nr:LLM class flavin-dependent oxidoreductase [Chloroflexota bacterium]
MAADLARQAEEAGWDGFFVWEPVWGVDAWVQLAAAAMTTSRIRLGTMLTPLPWVRPWKLAGEAAAVDNLSGGRVILSVGLGANDTGAGRFGAVTDRKTKAELLDEGLDILEGLWKGQPFAYEGKHYRLEPTDFNLPPPPVQQPRIPVWVVGVWPRMKSMRRALRWDGLLPARMDEEGNVAAARTDDVREAKAWVDANRPPGEPFDIVVDGETPGDDPAAAATVREWADAGATWWVETRWMAQRDEAGFEAVRARIRQGPPRED